MLLALTITTDRTATTSNDKAREVSSLVEPWDDILKFVVFLGSIVMPALTYMYQYCYIPGIGISTFISATVRSTWYRTFPLAHSWGSVLLVAVICEHLSFLLYYLFKRYYTEVTGTAFVVNTTLDPELNLTNTPTVHDDEIENIAEKVENSDYKVTDDATGTDTDFGNRYSKQPEQIQEKKQDVVTKESSSAPVTTPGVHEVEKLPPSTNVKDGENLAGDNVTENGGNSEGAEYGISNSVNDADGDKGNIIIEEVMEDDEPIQEEEDNEGNEVSKLSGRELKKKMDLRKISSIDLIPPITDTKLLGNAPSDVAGATLPTTIPTSKNYNTRLNADDVGDKEDVSIDKKLETAVSSQVLVATKSDLEPAVKKGGSPPDSPVKPLNVPKQRSGNDKTAPKKLPTLMKPKDEKTVQQSSVSSSITKTPVNEAIHDVGTGSTDAELAEPTKADGLNENRSTDNMEEGKEEATSSRLAYTKETTSDSAATSTASAPATPTSPEFIDKQQPILPQGSQVTDSGTQGQLQEPESLHFEDHPDEHHRHHHHGRFTAKSKAKVQSMLSKTRSNEEDKTLKKAKKKSLLSKLKGKI